MPDISITMGDAGRSFTLNVGDGAVITLEENLSTGYSWEVAGLPASISVVEASHDQPASHMVGATGTKVFRFAAIARGAGQIVLSLRRPWEPPGAAVRSFAIRVTVP